MTGNHDPKGPILVLIVEDNVDIQEAASLIFDLHWPKARIIQAYKGGDGILLAGSQSPDLVILDLGLPDMDGMRVLKEIRGFSAVPIIILTVRGEEMDKVRGLELGADDFIVKPFGHRELLARIRTVMQRHRSTTNQVAQPAQTQGATRLVMDFSSSTVWKDTKPLRLTATELSLLQYLASHSGSVLNDVEILATIWGADYTDCSEYLDVYIRRLREKLEDDPRQPRIILKEDKGYKFVQN